MPVLFVVYNLACSVPPVSLGRQGRDFSLRPCMSENVFPTLSPGRWFGYSRLLGWKIIFLWILKALFHWFRIPVLPSWFLTPVFSSETFRVYLFSDHTLDLVFVTPYDLWSMKHATTSVSKLFVFWFLRFFIPTWIMEWIGVPFRNVVNTMKVRIYTCTIWESCLMSK